MDLSVLTFSRQRFKRWSPFKNVTVQFRDHLATDQKDTKKKMEKDKNTKRRKEKSSNTSFTHTHVHVLLYSYF